ncbi:hypothetical protein A7D00_6416 [Trichophyton violaceum]|uniref:Uncharacterized protein n=1 Tax=Trichophyton violaceum TaxID=34388 RepID=A0A178FAY8_TRIVO|nr:hypothetical protein A7D00_6416 [Trichophyton violaceum]
MSYNPTLPIDIFVCYGKQRDALYPHWMLMGCSRNAALATWYHSTGGPTRHKPYSVMIQAGKPVDSPGIQSREYLGSVDPKHSRKITAAANRVPAQQCQKYVVALIAELEKQQLLPCGHAARLNRKVQMSATARDYAQQHPVPPPQIISPNSSSQPNLSVGPGKFRLPHLRSQFSFK